MTNVHIVRDNEGFIWQLAVKGHAGAGTKGNDIVCAAVSVLTFTALNSLDELAGLKCYEILGDCIKISVPSGITNELKPKVKTILDTIAVGFKQIEYTPEYREYVSVLDEEV